jgi:hypothetical protein
LSVAARVLFAFSFGLWIWMLYGFVPTGPLISLSVLGPLLLTSGAVVLRGAARQLLQPRRVLRRVLFALALVAGAGATLIAAAPADLLVRANLWGIVESRINRLTAAVDAGNVFLVRRLVQRGVGDDPRDGGGTPVIHRASTVALLRALLEAGLDPDARDASGRTLLTRTPDADMLRALLAAGADVDARDREGFTVADYVEDADIRALLEAHAGRPLVTRDASALAANLRTDWLTADGAATRPDRAGITIQPEAPRAGEVAVVTATLINATDEDQWLDVSATLNRHALFVSASHDGSIDRAEPAPLLRTVRWPLLSLPARREGRLELQVLAWTPAYDTDFAIELQITNLRTRTDERLELSRDLTALEYEPATADIAWSSAKVAMTAIGLVAVAVIVRGVFSRTGRRGGAPALVTAGVGAVCALMALLFAWQMAEPALRFEPEECTVLDRRVRIDTTRRERTARTATGTTRMAPRLVPVAAVRIEGRDGPTFAAGFDTSATSRPAHALTPFAPGARVACWVDPVVATRFTLFRMPSLSGGLAVGVLTLLAVVLLAIARNLRSAWASTDRKKGKDGSLRD